MAFFDWILGKRRARKGQICVVSQERIRLDFSQGAQMGGSLVDIFREARQLLDSPLSNPEFTGRALDRERQSKQLDEVQAKVLDRLVPISEGVAAQFFHSVGIDNPVRIRKGNVEGVFTNMRSRARLGDEYGELYYLSIRASKDVAAECLYVHQIEYGLLVCKLLDGAFLAYNTLGEMKAKLQLW